MEAAVNSVKKVVALPCFGLYSGTMTKKYFAFLRRLQANGRSNMYGAVPYLMRAFGLDRERAFAIICQWLDLQAEAATAATASTTVEVRHTKRTVPPVRKRRRLVTTKT
jgi:hypothetical protein